MGARDIIAKAKQNYLARESCPTCFRHWQKQGVFASMWNWIFSLLFGTGAVIAPTPVNLLAGRPFSQLRKR
jgi:hypothetical protein